MAGNRAVRAQQRPKADCEAESLPLVAIAQPAEHRTVDPKVMGSTPIGHPNKPVGSNESSGKASMKLDAALAFYPPLALLLVSLVILAIGDEVPGYLGGVVAIAWLGLVAWLWTTPELHSRDR
jgi:hypothetical protein